MVLRPLFPGEKLPTKGAGHTISDEGVALPASSTLNFVGAGVTVTNVNGVTTVTIPGGGGGSGVTSYTHVQSTPSTTWVVVHNLGFNPSIRAEDSAGNDIEGDVVFNTANQLTITFSAAIAGKSYHS